MDTLNKSTELTKKVDDIFEEISNPEDKWESPDKEGTTTSATHKKLSAEANKFLKNDDKTSPKAKALHRYSAQAYVNINNHLRKGEKLEKHNVPHIPALKELTKNPTQHEFLVYRGVSKRITGTKEGTLFKDKGFTSTSLKPRKAIGFTDDVDKPDKKTPGQKFRIHITPGTKGHYAAGNMGVGAEEREFILHPGTTFRVGKKHVHPNGETFHDLHIHSQED